MSHVSFKSTVGEGFPLGTTQVRFRSSITCIVEDTESRDDDSEMKADVV